MFNLVIRISYYIINAILGYIKYSANFVCEYSNC